ncbi:MAG: TIR domain-containing protein [Candidatus Aminicenantes bacterium]|nr:TIR domain-containing protein [Candidatus Aminicenantes bacterium]NIM79561.1 TIR domain-containing protein [Candidatus Aminicenantes bacterium]NIN18867.1 TIR domain-containing protein [Candidatus Aminicenantes bacterium]NIN42780.1 TIR domain-containing protein [Candidatus Aminicenantes bacterium]NIN85507.1 TIR domain-containing protein [Candidatus Aminicenantes bacterium]
MDFEYDVFISYRHLDNKPLIEGQEGWISTFHDTLKTCLGQELGYDPKIWIDEKKLKGNDEFGEEIISKLHKAKIILSVVSPGYFKSQWCMKELREFIKAAKSNVGLHIGNMSRIFKVVKTYVPHEEHPDEIRGLLGYEFYSKDDSDRPRTFRPDASSRFHQEFIDKVEDISFDIRDLFKDWDNRRESPPEKTVYLAETTSDLSEKREKILRDLKQQGYSILPDRHLPYLLKDGNFKDPVRGYLKRCKLSIHLIGNQYGLVPEGEKRSIIELQNEIASEQCENNQLKRLIWMPPGLDKNNLDEDQKNYITALQSDASQVPGTDLLQTTLEDFKTIIKEELEKINKPPAVKVKDDDLLYIYLMYDQQDKETAKLLDDCLYEEGFEVKQLKLKYNEEERRKKHIEYLRLCDAMMIYYNRASESWMETMLDELKRARGYREGKPIRAKALFITGEKTEDKESFRTHEAEIIKNYKPFYCQALSPFIRQLQEANGGGR